MKTLDAIKETEDIVRRFLKLLESAPEAYGLGSWNMRVIDVWRELKENMDAP